MNTTSKIALLAAALTLTGYTISAQEALLSTAENYFEFLALDGYASRPYLNYRTLSDSVWTTDDETGNLWSGVTLGTTRALGEEARLRVYGPELYTSFNSASPYGQNDGALWQGKGLNTSLTGGARLEAYGLELTLKPQLAFSQNLAFDLVSPAYSGTDYEDLADTWGYYGIASIDAPQRFGDDPLLGFSWGDSEIRYSWKTLTAGFGTQSIWLGPAKINPLLHSNNAAPYPKLDVGLRPQPVTVLGHYLGDVEGRAWWGRTTESDFFDSDNTNDHNLITGISLSYAPAFIPGATFGFHRTMLSKWNAMDYSSIFTLLWPFMEGSAGKDERDQRASVTFYYSLPKAGSELYLEWGRNDFSPSTDYVIRYPFHSQGYTIGARKSFSISHEREIRGQVVAELTNLESSRDYEVISFSSTFYAHHRILQGYTNRGQWLGAGIGTGGNSQYLGFGIFMPRSSTNFFIQRVNPNNDYVWYLNQDEPKADKNEDEKRIRADLSIGIEGTLAASKRITLQYAFVATDCHNYDYESNPKSVHRYNIHVSTGVSFAL